MTARSTTDFRGNSRSAAVNSGAQRGTRRPADGPSGLPLTWRSSSVEQLADSGSPGSPPQVHGPSATGPAPSGLASSAGASRVKYCVSSVFASSHPTAAPRTVTCAEPCGPAIGPHRNRLADGLATAAAWDGTDAVGALWGPHAA